MQTPQQRRAAHALAAIRKLEKLEPGEQAKRKSLARALPVMIRANGLGQAAAFYRSKGEAHEELYKVVSAWLCQEGQPFASQGDLLEAVTASEMGVYLAAQVEAIALAGWLSQLAQAFLADAPAPAQEGKG